VFERLTQVPAQVRTGFGTTRLDGMGGFETAVADENLEINLFDYSGNPAGYSEDRDSWSLDVRYAHQEFAGGNPSLIRNDIKINDGTFGIGYHKPGSMGIGGIIDYAEAQSQDLSQLRNSYNVVGFSLIANKFLFPKLSAGLFFSRGDESQDVFSTSIYDIDHETTTTRGALGIGYLLAPGVTLGFRGEVFRNQIDGESTSSTHDDVFDWERPGTEWSLHAFLDRGRLVGGADYTHGSMEGKEDVRLSWSERFIFNPTNETLVLETDTFSEDRSTDVFRTRWRLNVIPGRLAVSAAATAADEDFDVVTNPNAIGSLTPGAVKTSGSAVVGGASWIGLGNRLLVAGELKLGSSEVTTTGEEEEVENTRDELTLRVGGEYLLGSRVSGRLGLVRTAEGFDRTVRPASGGESYADLGSYDTTRLALGLGVVPFGAIWQIDFAYDVVLSSELDTDWSRISASLRHLF
jgi:hypothetical protein